MSQFSNPSGIATSSLQSTSASSSAVSLVGKVGFRVSNKFHSRCSPRSASIPKNSPRISVSKLGVRSAYNRSFTPKVPCIFNEQGHDVTPHPLVYVTEYKSRADSAITASTIVSTPTTRLSITGSFFSSSAWNIAEPLTEVHERLAGMTRITRFSEGNLFFPSTKKESTALEFPRKSIILTESDTYSLLDKPDIFVANEWPTYDEAVKNNDLYNEILVRHEGGGELVHKGVQTFFYPQKCKYAETVVSTVKDSEGMVSSLLLHEAYLENDDLSKTNSSDESFWKRKSGIKGCNEFSDFLSYIKESPDRLESFAAKLKTIERTLNSNTYGNVILIYKGMHKETDPESETKVLEKVESEEAPEDVTKKEESVSEATEELPSEAFEALIAVKPSLEHLISFSVDLVHLKYAVTSMTWNPSNSDIFAVGYTSIVDPESTLSTPGLIFCWTIKNCEYPERIFNAAGGVACLEFSKSHPYVLAAGMRNGIVALYDIRKKLRTSVVDNITSPLRPAETIGSLKWMIKVSASGVKKDVLLSVSQDGSLIQWIPDKGLKGLFLRGLRRVPVDDKEKEIEKDLVISFCAGGISVDINPEDPNIFIVGTNEGQIYQLTSIDPENYVCTYHFHKGPVYHLHWSPIIPGIFLSCSSDWTLCMWKIGAEQPSLILETPSRESILHAAWSLTSSTVFATITDTRLKIWDLSQSERGPVINLLPRTDIKFSCVQFCPSTSLIALGDDAGSVHLYELKNMPPPPEDQEAALANTFSNEI